MKSSLYLAHMKSLRPYLAHTADWSGGINASDSLPKLAHVTFTGADSDTAPDTITRIVHGAGELGVPVEIACLLSFGRRGVARYPHPIEAYELLRHARSVGAASIALHVCGRAARVLLTGEYEPREWNDGSAQVLGYAAVMGRVQINAPADLTTPENLQTARKVLTDVTGWHPTHINVIGQHRDPDTWPVTAPGVQYLYDCSGGNGVAPDRWPTLPVGQIVGLAGGLGPYPPPNMTYSPPGLKRAPSRSISGATCGNSALESALAAIDIAPAGASCWIDMETKIRDVLDRFSAEKCLAVAAHPLIRKLASSYSRP